MKSVRKEASAILSKTPELQPQDPHSTFLQREVKSGFDSPVYLGIFALPSHLLLLSRFFLFYCS